MLIGMIDVDWRHRQKMTFPNLALMKLSAWHKARGDTVIWYDTPITSGHVDICYLSKVFSDTYTPDADFVPDADQIIRGGVGVRHRHSQREGRVPQGT